MTEQNKQSDTPAPARRLEGSEAEIEQYNADRESQGMSEDPTAYPDWATDAQDSPAANVLSFPRELTDDLRDVLSTMLWTSGQIARCLRAGGAEIKTRAEDEQAYVLHWLIGLALEHGSEWRVKAQGRIREIRDTQPATTEGSADA